MVDHNAFTQPQRQSAVGIALLTVLNFGKMLKNMWPVLIYYFYKYKTPDGLLVPVLLVAGAVVFFAAISYLQYRNFTYFINLKTDEFVISSGIITRKIISIERSKIQEININQPFIHKLFNIFQLEVDSPGSDKKEVTVNAISYYNAVQLKQYLLENRTVGSEDLTEAKQQEQVSEKIIQISKASLIKYGLTANYVGSFLTILAFGFYILQQAIEFFKGEAFESYVSEAENWQTASDFQPLTIYSVVGIVIFVTLIFMLGILVNIIRILLKFYGMKVSRRNETLSLEYGLLNTKNSIVGRKKVQMITEVQNFLQKKVNVLQLKFNQISDNEHHKDSFTAIPGCSESEKRELLKFIWKEIPRFHHSMKPNIGRLITRKLFLIVIPLVIALFAKPVLGGYFWLILVYIVIVELLLIFAFINNRLYFNDDFIRVKSGIWDVENKTIEIHKIQAVKLSQYFWQKKKNLGSVTFFTAGGKLRFKSTQFAALKKLVNYSIFRVENSAKDWM